MNIRQLETFLRTADAGSFLRASEVLYISPNAVAKQINTMERELGLALFRRGNRGLTLTDAGRSFYADTEALLQQYAQSVVRAKDAAQAESHVLRVGTSPLTPSRVPPEIWARIHALCPGLQMKLVPFENRPNTCMPLLQNLGTDIDVVLGMLDNAAQWPCRGLTLRPEPLCMGVSVTHPLARKSRLTLRDLAGERLLILQSGRFAAMDELKAFLRSEHPEIGLQEFPFYDIGIFNRCETTQDLLVAVQMWDSVHPLIRILPVEWDFCVPFGILYAEEPSPAVQAFLRAAAQAYGTAP